MRHSLLSGLRRLLRAGMAVALLGAAPPPPPSPAPTLELLDGRVMPLDRFRGRVVILNYWATWCAPCRRELAEIDALAAAQPDDLAAIAVLAEPRPDPRLLAGQAAVLRIAVARRFTAGGERFPLARGAVPTTYLLDRSGAVRFVKQGAFAAGELAVRLRPLLEPGG